MVAGEEQYDGQSSAGQQDDTDEIETSRSITELPPIVLCSMYWRIGGNRTLGGLIEYSGNQWKLYLFGISATLMFGLKVSENWVGSAMRPSGRNGNAMMNTERWCVGADEER